MRRRWFLALLAPLTTGCLGGVEVSRQGEQPTGDDAATANDADGSNASAPATATPTPTPEPESTPDPGAATDEADAARQLRVARERLRESVEAYSDRGEIAAVGAADEFVARDVYVSLVRAAGAVEEAGALAATDDQVDRAEALSGVVAFLSRATAGQAAMAAGYEALLDVPEALRAGDVARARELVDDVGAHRRAIERSASLVRSESTDADVEATDVVADDARRRKLAQFDAAVAALDDATRPTRVLVDGVERLIEARAAATANDDDEASELAGDAEVTLDDADDDLSALADDLPDEASPFASAIDTLAEYAADRHDEAGDIRITY
jgi:hypothetical protein